MCRNDHSRAATTSRRPRSASPSVTAVRTAPRRLSVSRSSRADHRPSSGPSRPQLGGLGERGERRPVGPADAGGLGPAVELLGAEAPDRLELPVPDRPDRRCRPPRGTCRRARTSRGRIEAGASSSSAAVCSTASRSKPPANTERRPSSSCSGGERSSNDHCTRSWRVRWRASTAGPWLRRENRSWIRSSSWSADSDPIRAAASSSASGTPSSWMQSSATARALRSPREKPGAALVARFTKTCDRGAACGATRPTRRDRSGAPAGRRSTRPRRACPAPRGWWRGP